MNDFFRWFGLPGSFVLTCLMSILALTLAAVSPSPHRIGCAAAMLLSTAGDIVLMNFRGIGSRLPVPYFYVGAGFFILAHIAYIAAFLLKIRQSGGRLMGPGALTAVCIVLAAWVVLTVMTLQKGRTDPVMYALCFVYMCIIGLNCMTIFSCAFSAGGWHLLAAAGALSFFISDLIIGLDKLAGITSPALEKAIWWFYPVGQILILVCG